MPNALYTKQNSWQDKDISGDKGKGKGKEKEKEEEKEKEKGKGQSKNPKYWENVDKGQNKGNTEEIKKDVKKVRNANIVTNRKKSIKGISVKSKAVSENRVSVVQDKTSTKKKNIEEIKENAAKRKNEKKATSLNSKKYSTKTTYGSRGDNSAKTKSQVLSNNNNNNDNTNNSNYKNKNVFSRLKKNESSSKKDIASHKENRLINQKICNTSIDLDDVNNLSDDDRFIFDTYLNNENEEGQRGKEQTSENENLSEIINSQVKAFEQVFL